MIVWDKVFGLGATNSITGMVAVWTGLIVAAYLVGRSIEKVARIFARRAALEFGAATMNFLTCRAAHAEVRGQEGRDRAGGLLLARAVGIGEQRTWRSLPRVSKPTVLTRPRPEADMVPMRKEHYGRSIIDLGKTSAQYRTS